MDCSHSQDLRVLYVRNGRIEENQLISPVSYKTLLALILRSSHMSAAHDYLSANREYFDKQALLIDDRPNAQGQPRRIGSAIKRKYGSLFNEETTTLMDFACGTGAIFIGSMLRESTGLNLNYVRANI